MIHRPPPRPKTLAIMAGLQQPIANCTTLNTASAWKSSEQYLATREAA